MFPTANRQLPTTNYNFTIYNNSLTQKHILFLTLKVFSATGGIEKVCRVMGKALYEYGLENDKCVEIMSMHDTQNQAERNIYFPNTIFTGYAVNKVGFVLHAVKNGRKADVVIISHINLLVTGWLIKKVNPNAKIILLAHGIEIWGKLRYAKRKMLDLCDEIICVSNFTAAIIAKKQELKNPKISVLNNCLDPFLNNQHSAVADNNLRKHYAFTPGDVVLLTLTRLSAKDRYKGYEFVLEAMMNLTATHKNIKYLLAGGSSDDEKVFLKKLIQKHSLQDNVILAGYIPDEDLPALFSMADVYVMPSTKEGFGIVFIEAMYYSLPVIAGNKDGSTDALLDGKLGLLIEPNSSLEIEKAVNKIIENKKAYEPNRQLLMENFGYDVYKKKLQQILYN